MPCCKPGFSWFSIYSFKNYITSSEPNVVIHLLMNLLLFYLFDENHSNMSWSMLPKLYLCFLFVFLIQISVLSKSFWHFLHWASYWKLASALFKNFLLSGLRFSCLMLPKVYCYDSNFSMQNTFFSQWKCNYSNKTQKLYTMKSLFYTFLNSFQERRWEIIWPGHYTPLCHNSSRKNWRFIFCVKEPKMTKGRSKIQTEMYFFFHKLSYFGQTTVIQLSWERS